MFEKFNTSIFSVCNFIKLEFANILENHFISEEMARMRLRVGNNGGLFWDVIEGRCIGGLYVWVNDRALGEIKEKEAPKALSIHL